MSEEELSGAFRGFRNYGVGRVHNAPVDIEPQDRALQDARGCPEVLIKFMESIEIRKSRSMPLRAGMAENL